MTTHGLPDLPPLTGDVPTDLRRLADFFEAHPELAPTDITLWQHGDLARGRPPMRGHREQRAFVETVAAWYGARLNAKRDHRWTVLPLEGGPGFGIRLSVHATIKDG